MGARGPAPLPTAVKVLRGNPGKRRLNDREPQPGAERLPSAPRWMGEEARRQWRKVAGPLHRCGLLTEIDALALAMLCEAFAQYIKAKETVDTDGMLLTGATGNLYQHPAVSLMKGARVEILKWAREFGMTPSARSRITLDAPGEEESLADFLFGEVGEL